MWRHKKTRRFVGSGVSNPKEGARFCQENALLESSVSGPGSFWLFSFAHLHLEDDIVAGEPLQPGTRDVATTIAWKLPPTIRPESLDEWFGLNGPTEIVKAGWLHNRSTCEHASPDKATSGSRSFLIGSASNRNGLSRIVLSILGQNKRGRPHLTCAGQECGWCGFFFAFFAHLHLHSRPCL